MITITLKQILAEMPCSDGWAKVLHAQGKITREQLAECIENKHVPLRYSKLADDTDFPLSSIIDSNGLDDCLWALHCVDDRHYPLMRKFAVWSARRVQHLMTDERSTNALDVAGRHSDGLATDEELNAAWAAASTAAGAVARAARAAGAVDRDARAATSAATLEAQKTKLKQILDAGHWVE